MEKFVENAMRDVEILGKLNDLSITKGSVFRVKQLGDTITHSGSIFMRLCNYGILKVVERNKEVVEIVIKKTAYRDKNGTMYERWHYVPRALRETVEDVELEEKLTVETTYNVYELLVDTNEYALKSYTQIMNECQQKVFEQMARVESKVASIYESYYKLRNEKWNVEWEIRRESWKRN